MSLLVNTANVLFVLGHFTMDLLRLRLLSVVATSCLAVCFASPSRCSTWSPGTCSWWA